MLTHNTSPLMKCVKCGYVSEDAPVAALMAQASEILARVGPSRPIVVIKRPWQATVWGNVCYIEGVHGGAAWALMPPPAPDRSTLRVFGL
jgi:hypothetical protein